MERWRLVLRSEARTDSQVWAASASVGVTEAGSSGRGNLSEHQDEDESKKKTEKGRASRRRERALINHEEGV